MTTHDLAKEWRYNELAIENAAKLFGFCDKLINGNTSSVDLGDVS
jgi:hypothetical protein